MTMNNPFMETSSNTMLKPDMLVFEKCFPAETMTDVLLL